MNYIVKSITIFENYVDKDIAIALWSFCCKILRHKAY